MIERDQASSDTKKRPVTVFLVEDNVVDIKAVRRAFSKHRIANPVVVAKDGVEALERLREPGAVPRPLLILLDLNMPRMSGLEFLEQLRKDPQLKQSIVFVFTTSSSDEDKVESYGFNVAGYIVKGEVGPGFLRLVNMLDQFWTIVAFPDS